MVEKITKLFVVFLLLETTSCAMKPATTFQNSLNALQDAPSLSISKEIVEKLEDIAKVLKDGYQGVRINFFNQLSRSLHILCG